MMRIFCAALLVGGVAFISASAAGSASAQASGGQG